MLIGELERGLLRGEETAGAELVLQELRRSARETGRPSQRIGSLARLFFQPLEPFLVDDAATHKHPGRIARVALEPIWEWISRDLLPGEAKSVSGEVSRAYAENDTARAELLARGFQDRVAQRMQEALAAADTDDKAKRRLAVQVSTPRAFEDLQAVLGILKLREPLSVLSKRIPSHIKSLDESMRDDIKALLDSPAIVPPDMFLPALLVVMSRLATPWQLIRFATKAAGSDLAARVAETPYAIAVSIVLAEIERMVGELRLELRSGRGVAVSALLKTIHDAVRGVRTEMDLSVDSTWGKQLAAVRAEISDLLKSEIESMPGRVRRMLRPRPAQEIAFEATLNADDVAETESLVEFVGTCRNYAGELAISEMTQRAYTELQQYLEVSTQVLMGALRQANDTDRKFRRSQFDAAVRFCAKVFGAEYAAQLAKAGEVALGEHKAAKAS